MSDRPNIKPNTLIPIINNTSMATSITGPVTNVFLIPGISYDLVWTGSPTGTFQVQVSNSYVPNADGTPGVAGSWSTLPVSSFAGTYPVPSGSPGNGFLDVVGTEAAWVRLVYTASGGTGNLTVVAAAKVL